MKRAVAALGLGLVLAAPARAHVALDPDRAQEMMAEVARHHAATREEPGQPAGLDALFKMGEAVERLVEAMNQDLSAHGSINLLSELLVKRLQTYGIRVAYSDRARRYGYDSSAFEEYLRRAPGGRFVPDAKFKLLARAFYGTMGADPATLVDADPAGLLRAIAAEERFLRDHPNHEKAGEVQFFLAVDYYRASRNAADPARARAYAERARRELARVVARLPETAEARAAETLLEQLDGAAR